MLRLPGWLAFLIFVPLQIFLAIKLYQAYGFWWLLAILLVLGVLGTRASRAHWLRAAFWPGWAAQWEARRHIYQGILFLIAAIAFVLVVSPQPWVAAGLDAWLQRGHPWVAGSALVSLVKAALR
ncbi:MAG: hypothetical protein WDA16_01385 [Candidatus Thermoplasmatota archaeon]